jgi:asparagine synthase (glutamine-hydrolysing)
MAYLRNQLLRDSDWASMAHSLELRTPLVDAWLLRDLMPVLRSFGRLYGKRMLAASPTLPLRRHIVERSKTGFGIPLGAWMNSALEKMGTSTTPFIMQGGTVSRRWALTISQAFYS